MRWLLAVILPFVAGVASAQQPPAEAPAAEAADPGPPPVPPQCGPMPETDQARRALAAYWFEQGRSQVDREAFVDAEFSFGCSQVVIPHPSTLYNLARAAEWAGDLQTALRALREYVETVPDAENRAEVDALVVRIVGEIELSGGTVPEPGPVELPLLDVVEPPPTELNVQRLIGWIAVAVAGASGAAGATLGAFAAYEQATIDNPPDGIAWRDLAEHEAQRDDYVVGMSACLGAAVAFAVAGTVLLLVDDDADLGIVPAAWQEGAGLALVGRF